MVLRRVKDRLKKFNVAVSEIEYQALWQRAALAVVTVSTDQAHAAGSNFFFLTSRQIAAARRQKDDRRAIGEVGKGALEVRADSSPRPASRRGAAR